MSARFAFCRKDELVLVEGGKIVERRRIPKLQGAATSSDGRLVYFVDAKWPTEMYDLTQESHVFDDSGRILVAHDARIVCALFRDDIVYLGGTRRGSVLVKARHERDKDRVIDSHVPCVRALNVRTHEDFVAELPPVDKFTSCAIDAFALDGDRLYAFDNVMVPIFLFELDVSDAARPKSLEVLDVTRGLWARVLGAGMCAGHCVALQLEGSSGGPTSTLVVFEPGTFQPLESIAEDDAWNALAVGDTRAFVAAERGVGIIDVTRRPLTITWKDVGKVDDLRLHGSTLTLFRDAEPPVVWTLEV